MGYLLDGCTRGEVRAPIFIRSCCAIMISPHHCSRAGSDVSATRISGNGGPCLFPVKVGATGRVRNIEFVICRIGIRQSGDNKCARVGVSAFQRLPGTV